MKDFHEKVLGIFDFWSHSPFIRPCLYTIINVLPGVQQSISQILFKLNAEDVSTAIEQS
jgi:hypothetical protein